jgi:hypoxanthine phosphoribosyltransferase
MKLNIKNNMTTLMILIVFIFLYHYFIHNGLEKFFCETYFDYNYIKRPLVSCSDYLNGKKLGCIGMPSGHAETTTILSLILYYKKLIPFWICLLIIFGISLQRIVTNKHSLIQVLMGITVGYMYFNIYKYFDLSIYSLVIVFMIGFILSLLVIYRLNKEIYKPIPKWVSPEMIPSIQNKQNSLFYMKILTIYANALKQNRTFITWHQLENYLDIIVEKIKNSGENYDAVIGIKTGGAIISDYISQKLNLPNYKVKLSRKEYNCNKQSYNTFNDLINKNIFSNLGEYTVCEPIEHDLQGKNVILVDEMVSSGKTMVEAVEYLKNEKGVNTIYPTTITLNKKLCKQELKIDYIMNDTIMIWPWGYDN